MQASPINDYLLFQDINRDLTNDILPFVHILFLVVPSYNMGQSKCHRAA